MLIFNYTIYIWKWKCEWIFYCLTVPFRTTALFMFCSALSRLRPFHVEHCFLRLVSSLSFISLRPPHSVPSRCNSILFLFRTVPLPHEFKHSFDMYRFICPTVSWLRSVFSPFYKASLSDIRFLFSGTPRSIVFSVPFHPVSWSVLFRFVQFPPVLFTRTPYWNYF